MAPHVTKRQPISCENCRNRKIKCTGGRVPCESCVRRGFQDSCHFIRSTSAPQDGAAYNDLVERIASLEALLKQHISANVPCQPHNGLSTPAEYSSASSISPRLSGSLTLDEGGIAHSNFPLTGFLLKYPGGYVRFVPHTESLNSEDMAAFVHTESPLTMTHTSEFPFSNEMSSSKQVLLDLLPSKRQCDELIRRYLDVFSPVKESSFPSEFINC